MEGQTDGQTDRQTEVHIVVVPTLKYLNHTKGIHSQDRNTGRLGYQATGHWDTFFHKMTDRTVGFLYKMTLKIRVLAHTLHHIPLCGIFSYFTSLSSKANAACSSQFNLLKLGTAQLQQVLAIFHNSINLFLSPYTTAFHN